MMIGVIPSGLIIADLMLSDHQESGDSQKKVYTEDPAAKGRYSDYTESGKHDCRFRLIV